MGNLDPSSRWTRGRGSAIATRLTHRSRPAAHFCEPEHAVAPCPPDTRLSFYAGHTSSAFAAAVAAGTLADFHHLENRKWIWASGLTFASAIARPAAPAVVAAVPVMLLGGRSAALVTVGSIGGGPYVGFHWHW